MEDGDEGEKEAEDAVTPASANDSASTHGSATPTAPMLFCKWRPLWECGVWCPRGSGIGPTAG